MDEIESYIEIVLNEFLRNPSFHDLMIMGQVVLVLIRHGYWEEIHNDENEEREVDYPMWRV